MKPFMQCIIGCFRVATNTCRQPNRGGVNLSVELFADESVCEGNAAASRASGQLRRAPKRVIVVVTGPNPSFDYYLAPRLKDIEFRPDAGRRSRCGSLHLEAREFLTDAFILFCRYTSGAWMRRLDACTDLIAGVGLFIDDDIDALAIDGAVPLPYRLRLWRLHLAQRRGLIRHCDLLLVANPDWRPAMRALVRTNFRRSPARRTIQLTELRPMALSWRFTRHRCMLPSIVGCAPSFSRHSPKTPRSRSRSQPARCYRRYGGDCRARPSSRRWPGPATGPGRARMARCSAGSAAAVACQRGPILDQAD